MSAAGTSSPAVGGGLGASRASEAPRRRRSARSCRAALLLATLAAATPAAAQLPTPSATVLGMGGVGSASARGFGAMASNPAGLAMPRPADFTLALFPFSLTRDLRPIMVSFLPVSVSGGIRPVTLGDLEDFEGEDIPHAVREAWLQRVEAAGGETGSAEAHVIAGAVSVGSFGFQLATSARVRTRLNPDGTELLLFGNAGRTGEPREFQLGGSSFDASVVTTAAFAAALPLDIHIGDAPGQSFAVGAALKVTFGHVLFLARDLGSTLAGDPLQADLSFPVVQTDTLVRDYSNGVGLGLDLGFQWEAEAWGAGLVVKNLVRTFEWDLDELYFRPGTALFDQDRTESDLRARPAREAPATLLRPVREFDFGRSLGAGLAHRAGKRLTVAAELQALFGSGTRYGPDLELGMGARYHATPSVPLTGHLAAVTGGLRVGGGAGLQLRRFHISGAASYLTRERAAGGMVALSLGGS